jgi:GTP-binding protein Era
MNNQHSEAPLAQKAHKRAFKSGFVALAGRPNAGKSTLLNAMVGTKIAIVSPRPQTTRFNIHGAIHRRDGQAVLVDTPGLFLRAGSRLVDVVNQRLSEAVEDIDLVVHVVDPTRPTGPEEKAVERIVERVPRAKILVINKADLPDRPFLQEYYSHASAYDAAFEISALTGKGVPALVDEIFSRLPPGEPIFPEYQVTDQSNEQWVAELIREKVFLHTSQEVPYTTTVEVEQIADRPARRPGSPPVLYVKANIVTLSDRYKPMLIGTGGSRLRQIGEAARRELEVAMNRKVFLDLQVKVDKHWMERFA